MSEAALLLDLKDRIANALDQRIAPMFSKRMKLTLVARDPDHPSRTVIVSSDDVTTVVRAEVLVGTTETKESE